MVSNHKSVYVISALHVGGDTGEPGKRGFRICTQEEQLARFISSPSNAPAGPVELVIIGDSVDFLAEKSLDEPHSWRPLHGPENHVVQPPASSKPFNRFSATATVSKYPLQ